MSNVILLLIIVVAITVSRLRLSILGTVLGVLFGIFLLILYYLAG